ncbi:zinc finger protein 592 isoform X2 [Latimeria chalumnae]|uniref:zinc finger protein 592 isoform X2 n=1 Tax=Latimeria chalumnae TaxID=7897 RepID=UPI00313B71F6
MRNSNGCPCELGKALTIEVFSRLSTMGDMKTPDFDDLLAAFDIPDPTSLDAKEAIQSTSDETEGHLKSAGMCLDEPMPHSTDVPAVSVIVKNTSRQESFEAITEKDGSHLGHSLLQNGFQSSDVAQDPQNIGHSCGKFESSFINGDSSRSYSDKTEATKPESLPNFSQFSPISSPEPEETDQDNGVANQQSENPYFPPPPPPHSMYAPPESSVLDNLGKPQEPELSMFDQCNKKEQKSEIGDGKEAKAEPTRMEKGNTSEKSEESNKELAKNSFLGEMLPFDNLHSDSGQEETKPGLLSEANLCSSVPPRQRLKTAHSKLSSCVAALVALQAKKVAETKEPEQVSSAKEPSPSLKEGMKGSPKMPKSPKSPRSPLEVMKKTNKQPDSPRSICSDSSSKGSPSVAAGSPPAIPKVRIKTIKTSSGEIKRTVTRILPDSETDDPAKSPEHLSMEGTGAEEPIVKPSCVLAVQPNTDAITENGKSKSSTKNSSPPVVAASSIKAESSQAVSVKEGSIGNKKRPGLPTAPLQAASSAIMKVVKVVQQNRKQQQQISVTQASNSTSAGLLPKAVHLANLNLVPHSVAASVTAKSTSQRQTQPQLTTQMVYSTVPLVHQVKKAAPMASGIVEAFNKLLNSANPVPVYTPNLKPPPDSSISLPARGYRCLECGDSFALEKSLVQHYSRRSVHIEVMCTHCSKTLLFVNKCSLLAHAREHKSKGVVMQCSQILMKPISSDQMFSSSLGSSSAPPAAQASPLLPALQASGGTSGSGTKNSTNVQPAMPLCSDPSRLIRYGPKCLECNTQAQDYVFLAAHYQRFADETDGLTCQVCQMMLPNKCSYAAHQRIHAHKSPFCCPECGAMCRSAYFQTHVKENCLHYARKVGFRCIHCGVVFMSLGMLKVHIQDKHCEVFHKCSFCPMAFKSAESATNHIQNQHPAEQNKTSQKKMLHQHFYQNVKKLLVCVFKCPECQLVYMQKQLLMQHVKGVHGVPQNVDGQLTPKQKPEVTSSSQPATSATVRTSNDTSRDSTTNKTDTTVQKSETKARLKNPGWTCGQCLQWLPDREAYVSHMKKSHGKSMKRYPCRQCDRSFSSSNSVRRHVRAAHDGGKKTFACWYCTDEKHAFPSRFMLENHISLMHGIKNPDFSQMSKPVPTENPTAKASEEAATIKRKAEETDQEKETIGVSEVSPAKKLKAQYRCSICGFMTDSCTDFQEHIPQHKTHSSTFQCLHCGLCYTSQISLNRHLFIVHKVKESDEEEEEKEEEKEESMDTSQGSENGQENHNGDANTTVEEENGLQCKICGKACDNEAAYSAHMRTHGMSFLLSKHNGGSEQ